MTDYKTQAEQLVDEFYQLLCESDDLMYLAKECAIIAISKTLEEAEWGGCNSAQIEELENVKKAIYLSV
tara:strand:+ start:262 stop:468 length:207 start_codon:yes stop_codon:yes gene_type:complete